MNVLTANCTTEGPVELVVVVGLVAVMGGAVVGHPGGEDLLFMLDGITLGMWNVDICLLRMFRILLVNISLPFTPCIYVFHLLLNQACHSLVHFQQ